MAEKSKYQDIDAVDAALDKGVAANDAVGDSTKGLTKQVTELEQEMSSINNSVLELTNYVEEKVGYSDKESQESIEFTAESYMPTNTAVGDNYTSKLSTSTAYSHCSFVPEIGGEYKITTQVSTSSKYNYYIHLVDEDDNILEQYITPSTSGSGETKELSLVVVNEKCAKVYVGANSTTDLFYQRVSIVKVETKLFQTQIDENSNEIEDIEENVIAGYPISVGRPLLEDAMVKVIGYNEANRYLNFAYITDTHHRPEEGVYYRNALNNIKLFAECGRQGVVDFLAHGGDVISAYGYTQELSIKAYSKTLSLLKGVNLPLYISKGNHDNGGAEGNDNANLLNDIQSALIIRPNEVVVGNPDVGYYYKDYEDRKIRIITLCRYCQNYEDTETANKDMAEQLVWFSTIALLSAPEDYNVIVFIHCSGTDAGNFANILKAFNESTSVTGSFMKGYPYDADFSGKPTKRVVAYIHGHGHIDSYSNANGFNDIGVLAGYVTDKTLIGTSKEYKFDVFTIDTDNKVIYETRVGQQWNDTVNPERSVDRSFSWDSITELT